MATTINNHKTSSLNGQKKRWKKFLPPFNEVKIVFRWVCSELRMMGITEMVNISWDVATS
jgi:hypothetical protein